MRYVTQITIAAPAADIFAELHRYKVRHDAGQFFRLPFVRIDFRVLSDHVLGVGATYGWVFRIFGVAVCSFTEQIVEWAENRVVAYKAIAGWQMLMRTQLIDEPDGTRVKTEFEYGLRPRFLEMLLYPVIAWGLRRVYRQMKERIEAR